MLLAAYFLLRTASATALVCAAAFVVVELGKEKQEGKTDAEGRFAAKLAGPGVYAARAWRIDETPGERDGKKYEDVRYYSTLILDVE